MAMTTAQKTEMYRFFIVAFDAAPGVTYMNQLDEALSAGMTTRQIVNVFTNKSQFLDTYPTSLTATQFATRIVDTVVKQAASAAAKQKAVKDIETALGTGMSRGDVVYNIFSNLGALPTTDADWGQLVRQMNNQIAAADYFTYTLLRSTTSIPELRSAIAGVTDSVAGSSMAKLSYSTTRLIESEANDGSVATSIVVTLSGDQFAGKAGDKLGSVSNVPAGLTASLTKLTDTTAALSLTGKATAALASNSISNLNVQFSANDFATKLIPSGVSSTSLGLTFRDLWPKVSGTTLSVSQKPVGEAVINLASDTITHLGSSIDAVLGQVSSAVNIDLSGVPALATGEKVTGSFSMIGTTENNTFSASPLGDKITTGGGNDAVVLGAGVDRVIFPRESLDSMVTITNFKSGGTGDVLDFSSILVKPGTKNLKVIDTNLAPVITTWANGDILLLQTVAGNTAAQVAALFGTYLANPTTASKLIVLTADVTSDTRIWMITNLSGSGVTAIEPEEVRLIGVLKDVNNLSLGDWAAANFGG